MNERGFVALWILKIIILFAIVALGLLEVGGAVISRTQAQDLAGQAATEANINYFSSRDPKQAEQRARDFVERNGMTFEALVVDTTAQTMSVTVAKQAPGVVLRRFERTKRFTDIHVTQSVPLRK